MAMTMHIDIVSAEAEIYSGTVEVVVAPAIMGEVGIHPRHTQMMTPLKPGEVRVTKQGGEEESFYVSGGMLEVQPHCVTVLSDTCVRAHDLDEAAVLMELFEVVPSFRCLKVETTPAGVKYSRILELSCGMLHVSGGWAVNQMLEGLRRGVHAFMPTGMHWIYTSIFKEFQRGNIDEATALFNEILPILAFSNQYLDLSVHFFKRLLWKFSK